MRAKAIAVPLALTLGASALRGQAEGTSLERMPAPLETRWALSALPPTMRERATVYLLDPSTGYRLAHRGTNGQTCVVQRTVWELADFRNDIYIPLCYDAVGAAAQLRVTMEAAALRARGTGAAALKAEVERRYTAKVYGAPRKAGLSYMLAPTFRTIGPPDMRVHTFAMPHVMSYAPFLTNDDIGATPNLADMSTLRYPFIDRQGNGEQSVMIHMLGRAETDAVLTREKALVDDLCAYRALLCLPTRH
jgi:hypothetical protein